MMSKLSMIAGWLRSRLAREREVEGILGLQLLWAYVGIGKDLGCIPSQSMPRVNLPLFLARFGFPLDSWHPAVKSDKQACTTTLHTCIFPRWMKVLLNQPMKRWSTIIIIIITVCPLCESVMISLQSGWPKSSIIGTYILRLTLVVGRIASTVDWSASASCHQSHLTVYAPADI